MKVVTAGLRRKFPERTWMLRGIAVMDAGDNTSNNKNKKKSVNSNNNDNNNVMSVFI